MLEGADPLADLARQLQYAYSFPPPDGFPLYDPQQQPPTAEEDKLLTRLDEALRSESLDDIKRRLERLLPED